MSSFGSRLQEERARLGISQAQFAELGGIKRSSQYLYEHDARCPDAEYLARIARAGVDIAYLIEGQSRPQVEGVPSSLTEAQALAAANKRIGNVLKKADSVASNVDASLLSLAAEQTLYAAMQASEPNVSASYASGDFTSALLQLAKLRDAVDAFFNDVMVMDENLQLRNNRLALLQQLHGMMNQVADISKLVSSA